MPSSPVRRASHVRRASVNLHWKISPSALRSLCAPCPFVGAFWMPSRCQNWVQGRSMERSLSVLANPIKFFQFGVHFPYKKIESPKTGQNVPNGAASWHSAVAVNV